MLRTAALKSHSGGLATSAVTAFRTSVTCVPTAGVTQPQQPKGLIKHTL